MKFSLGLSAAVLLLVASAHADTFGSGPNTFTIDFVNVGNAGNADDTGAGGGSYFTNYGRVTYAYRMGTYEIPQDTITKATASGLLNVTAGYWTGLRPATTITWYESAAFVNWLNTSTGHQAAYDLTWTGSAWTMNLWSSGNAWQMGGENLYRHKDAYYFLPSEDEWYKAAYHKNDGVTANYWDYATGSNVIPDGIGFSGDTGFQAVFDQGFNQGAPNAVTNVGLTSAYGTVGQNGNVGEWQESGFDGINNSVSENRAIRGGDWGNTEVLLRSSVRIFGGPSNSITNAGFRVASVPEPSSAVLMLGSGLVLLFRRGSRARG